MPPIPSRRHARHLPVLRDPRRQQRARADRRDERLPDERRRDPFAVRLQQIAAGRTGVGFLILQRNLDLNMPAIFAILTALGAIGMGLHRVVQRLQRRLVFWDETQDDHLAGV